jgi:hypothetical protein
MIAACSDANDPMAAAVPPNTRTRLAARLSFADHPAAADVRQSFTAALDASMGPAIEALHRLDLTARPTRALRALDVGNRIALFPTHLAAPCVNSISLGLIWRIDGTRRAARITPDDFEGFGSAGHIKVRWSVDLRPSESGVFLSIATRFTATDAGSRARLLDAWAVIGPLSDAFVEGAARSIKAYADDLEDELGTASGSQPSTSDPKGKEAA